MAAYYVEAIDKLNNRPVTVKVSGGDIRTAEDAMNHVNNTPGSNGGKHPGLRAVSAKPRDTAPTASETPAEA